MKERFADAPARSAAWATASSYQLGHALAGVVAALPVGSVTGGGGGGRLLAPRASAAFTAGSLLFASGLYVFAATGVRGAAAAAPVGGAVMIGGWLALAAGA